MIKPPRLELHVWTYCIRLTDLGVFDVSLSSFSRPWNCFWFCTSNFHVDWIYIFATLWCHDVSVCTNHSKAPYKWLWLTPCDCFWRSMGGSLPIIDSGKTNIENWFWFPKLIVIPESHCDSENWLWLSCWLHEADCEICAKTTTQCLMLLLSTSP